MNSKASVILLVIVSGVSCGVLTIGESALEKPTPSTDHSPYLGIIFCSANDKPWECVREESSRLLDVWMGNLYEQWNDLKVEADDEVNATLQQRGFSLSQVKEKPSTILKKIEIGSNYIEEFVTESLNDFLGRNDEVPISENEKAAATAKDADDEEEEEEEVEEEETAEEGHETDEEEEEEESEEGDERKKQKKKRKKIKKIKKVIKGHGGHGGLGGVGRGKKKKKRKALAKVVFWGSLIKGKIELLLKVLSAHLQTKFFVIALVGLLINLARFWLDVKRGGTPQKVIYYEHAQHQHHYEDHGDDWNDQGSYWKRSLEPTEEIASESKTYDSVANVFNNDRIYSYSQPTHDAHYLAYRRQNRAF